MRWSVAGMSPSTRIYQVGWPTTFTSHLNTLVVLKSLKITKMLILKSFNKAFFGIWPALMGCLAAGMLLKQQIYHEIWSGTLLGHLRGLGKQKNWKRTNFRPEMTILTTLDRTFSSAVTSGDPRGQLQRSRRNRWCNSSSSRHYLRWCSLFPDFQRTKRKKCQNSYL